MREKAIEKLRTEMEQNKENAYIQLIGQFLIQKIDMIPELSEKIMDPSKTIANSLKFMEAEAKKKAGSSRMAMFTPDEGFAIGLKYYGIQASESASPGPASITIPQNKPELKFSLEDLL
jgi:hypothetical protein